MHCHAAQSGNVTRRTTMAYSSLAAAEAAVGMNPTASRGLPSLVPDKSYPTMWRIVGFDGCLSDMVNRTRAKDVALELAKSLVITHGNLAA
jgi:hypothetical protein